MLKTKARSTFNLTPIENNIENGNDLDSGIYQEANISFPRCVAPSKELKNSTILVDSEFEEVNPSIILEDEEDDVDDGSKEKIEYEHEFDSFDDD